MYTRREADDIVQRAYNKALLDIILPSLTNVLDTLESRLEVLEDISKDIKISVITTVETTSLIKTIVETIMDITGWCIYEFNKTIERYVIVIFCGNSKANMILEFTDR
jgi:hypothetical protein